MPKVVQVENARPMETRIVLLSHLDATVAQLLSKYHELPSQDHVAPGEWSARDILAHLTFWHESFARNVGDLVAGRKPTPLKGTLAELNRRSVDALGDCSPAELGQRFADAHAVIRAGILDPGLTLIPYRRGSRDLSLIHI